MTTAPQSQFTPQMNNTVPKIIQNQSSLQSQMNSLQTHGNPFQQQFQPHTFSMAYSNNLQMPINNSYLIPNISTMNTNNNQSLNSSISMDYASNSTEYSYQPLDREIEKVIEYIANLKHPDKREDALQELSKKRESFSNLAPYLWYSVGTVAIL